MPNKITSYSAFAAIVVVDAFERENFAHHSYLIEALDPAIFALGNTDCGWFLDAMLRELYALCSDEHVRLLRSEGIVLQWGTWKRCIGELASL